MATRGEALHPTYRITKPWIGGRVDLLPFHLGLNTPAGGSGISAIAGLGYFRDSNSALNRRKRWVRLSWLITEE